MKKLDETVLLQVLRDGKEHEFHIMVKPVSHFLLFSIIILYISV